MSRLRVDSKKLGEALEKFGSLQNALEHLLADKQKMEAQVAQLGKQNRELVATRDRLRRENKQLDKNLNDRKAELQVLSEEIGRYRRQYSLFAGFMAMLAGSPSVEDSLDVLITSLQRLKAPGWYFPKTADELRSTFIRSVMGDYLKSYRCEHCGAKFVVNKNPDRWLGIGGYCCPACHFTHTVREDDSFVQLMVSDSEQLDDVRHMDDVLKENEKLEAFRAFLKIPCEICHNQIEDWDEYNTRLVIQGIGFGHTSCWMSRAGQLRGLANALQRVREDTS